MIIKWNNNYYYFDNYVYNNHYYNFNNYYHNDNNSTRQLSSHFH